MRARLITAACLVMLARASAQERKQTRSATTATPASATTPIKDSATERGTRAPAGLVEQLFAAWSSHDADKVVAFYTDDVVYEDVPLGRSSHGRGELRKFVEDTFTAFPDLNVALESA